MNNFLDQMKDLSGAFGRLWDFLTKAHPSITDLAEQRQARLAASFIFAIAFLDLVGGLVRLPRVGVVAAFAGPIGLSFIVLLAAYFLARTKWHRVAIFLFAISFSSLAYVAMITQGNAVDYGTQVLIYVPISLIVASSFLSAPAVFLLVGLNVGAFFSVPLFGVDLPSNIGAQTGMITVMGVVLMLLTNFRNDTEKIRLDELREINRELESLTLGLEQRVTERTKALAITGEVSRSISMITDGQRLVKEVVEQLQSAFNYYHAHIYLLDDSGENLVMAGGTGEAGKILLAQEHSIPVGRGLVGRAAETKQTVLFSDTSQAIGWLPNPLLPDTKSEIAVPILLGEQVLGVLDVQNSEVGSLSQQDADLIDSIARQVAIALQNISSSESTAKRATELQTVAAISTAISSIRDPQQMLETVVHLTQRRFKLYHAHIFTFDEARDALVIAACGWKEGDEHEGTHGTTTIALEQEQSLVARAGRSRQPVVVNDVRSDPGWLPNPLLPDTAAELAVPLIVGDQLVGVLDVQADYTNAFSEEDANVHTTLASQVAIALQNARSFNLAQKQAQREAMLNLAAQRIQSTTTVELALQTAARELGHALGMRPTLAAIGTDTLDAAKNQTINE